MTGFKANFLAKQLPSNIKSPPSKITKSPPPASRQTNVTCLLALLVAAPPSYTIQLFEDIFPVAVDASGRVVGDTGTWDGKEVKALPKHDLAEGANEDGAIVGGSIVGQPWKLKDGVVTVLPMLPGHKVGWAHWVNASGVIVGGTGVHVGSDVPDDCEAVAWTDGVPKSLGLLPGDASSDASGINDKGWIVGYSHGVTWRPFLYRDDKMTELPTPKGFSAAGAFRINDRGVIVGWCRNRFQQACTWIDGRPNLLGILPGQDLSEAKAINSEGDIVGKSGPVVPSAGDGGIPKQFYASHAVLWTHGQMIDLTEIVKKIRLDVSAYDAVAINDKGQIVGSARVKWKSYCYILTPAVEDARR